MAVDLHEQRKAREHSDIDRLPRPGRKKGQIGFFGICRRAIWSWWLWVLLASVAISFHMWNAAGAMLLWAVFSYLVTPQEESPQYGLDSQFSISSETFLSSVAGATGAPFIKGNSVTVLNNGKQFYPVMLDAIAHARQSVTIEAYIYWAGDIGVRFAEVLASRARAGLAVKILLDAVGSSTIGSEILNELQAGGCQVAWFNPVRSRTIGRFNNRTHRKSLIIDGRVAFTGGAGIADHWLGDAENPKHWRDVQVRLEGPAAIALQTGFAQNWLKTTGELISGREYFPPLRASGGIAVQTVLSSPEVGASALRIMHYLSIVCAERRLYIANPYFIPDNAAIDILIDAKKRGVDVKIMVSGIHNDMSLARHGSVHLYGRLLEAGVEIYEYDRTMLHQKTLVADGVWVTVGTTNFDNRSFALNEESNICVYDHALSREFEEIFQTDLAHCTRVSFEAWKRRGLVAKIQGAASCFLRDQI